MQEPYGSMHAASSIVFSPFLFVSILNAPCGGQEPVTILQAALSIASRSPILSQLSGLTQEEP